jgi:hypothetical protein
MMSFCRFCDRDVLAVQAPQFIGHGLLSEADSTLALDSALAFVSAPALDSATACDEDSALRREL